MTVIFLIDRSNDTLVVSGVAINQNVNYCGAMNKTQRGNSPNTDQQLAAKITNALIIKGISVLRLADETGIAYPTLRRSLKGQRSLTFNEFGLIAQALDVQPSHLLPSEMVELAEAV